MKFLVIGSKNKIVMQLLAYLTILFLLSVIHPVLLVTISLVNFFVFVSMLLNDGDVNLDKKILVKIKLKREVSVNYITNKKIFGSQRYKYLVVLVGWYGIYILINCEIIKEQVEFINNKVDCRILNNRRLEFTLTTKEEDKQIENALLELSNLLNSKPIEL